MSISDKSAVVVAESRNATRKMLAEFWFYFSQNRGAVIGLVVFIALVIVALRAADRAA
jgi:dipeptide transport system permease protein